MTTDFFSEKGMLIQGPTSDLACAFNKCAKNNNIGFTRIKFYVPATPFFNIWQTNMVKTINSTPKTWKPELSSTTDSASTSPRTTATFPSTSYVLPPKVPKLDPFVPDGPHFFRLRSNPPIFEKSPHRFGQLQHVLATTGKKIRSFRYHQYQFFKKQKKHYLSSLDNVTIADYQLVTATMCLQAINFDFSSYPLVAKWYATYKSENPDLWSIVEGGMKEISDFEKNPPDLSHMTHPIHPVRRQ